MQGPQSLNGRQLVTTGAASYIAVVEIHLCRRVPPARSLFSRPCHSGSYSPHHLVRLVLSARRVGGTYIYTETSMCSCAQGVPCMLGPARPRCILTYVCMWGGARLNQGGGRHGLVYICNTISPFSCLVPKHLCGGCAGLRAA